MKQREIASIEKIAELMSSRVSRSEIRLQTIRSKQWNDTVRDALLSNADPDERESLLNRGGKPPPPIHFESDYSDRPTPDFNSKRQSFRRPPPIPNGGISNRVSLVDLDYVPVFGNIWPEDDVVYFPVFNGQSKTAYIAYKASKSQIAKQEKNFIIQQTIGFIVISLCTLALCAVIAWWLANRISHPIMSVARGARSLSKGQYGAQVQLIKGEVKLKDEIGQLVKDFNYLSRVLEKNEQSRLQWSSDIAHELRTPVAILKGELEAIGDGVRPLTQDSVTSLQEEVSMLEKMVSDLRVLTLSDAGALDYQMDSVSLNQILLSTVNSMEPLFIKQGLTLKYSLFGQPKNIHGDRERLRQLINNLLSNSLRYTDSPSQVYVALQVKDNIQEIIIEDGAPGVPTESLPLLFDRLYRVDKSRSRGTGGSGLGMAICKNITEAHGGVIHCSHSTLGGLKVSITFKDV
ncbi:ATP-binding protein [Litoribacillus peritrichatus]|uniref:ATP-binding protein n=1 Tax=Litoribacillus peritrichatus TaxID=718191 RepID=UPI0031D6FD1B